jgi:16S rRNA (cytosine1407-C5)-methyltransferase
LCREYPEYFDKILLDAPCSAEARFIDGDPKTYGYWKEQKIKEMAYKQWGLLLAAWSALKPGGILVYSTCTFAPEENELQITKFVERVGDCEILDIKILDIRRLPVVKEFKGKKVNPEVVKKAMRMMPTKEIEGFFVCKIKKRP